MLSRKGMAIETLVILIIAAIVAGFIIFKVAGIFFK
jgi:nitrogen fixation-related uncharacterized protein